MMNLKSKHFTEKWELVINFKKDKWKSVMNIANKQFTKTRELVMKFKNQMFIMK